MKKVFIVLIVVILALGGYFYYLRKKKSTTQAEAIETKVVEVQRGSISQTIEASGRVISNLDVEIKCKAGGEIISLPYDESDFVKKGTLVMELDPIDEQRNVSKAEVALNSAQARLLKSKQNLFIAEQELESTKRKANVTFEAAKVKADDAKEREKRISELYEKKLVSKEEYDSVRTAAVQAQAELEKAQIAIEEIRTQEASIELMRQDVKLAEAELKSAQINLSIAQQRLKETKVYAPIDGIITKRFVQRGQIISSATSNVGGGTSIMIISDLSHLFVIASVDESSIGEVTRGQKVDITADAFPTLTFAGVVERIAPVGESVSNVVTFDVRIKILSEEATGNYTSNIGTWSPKADKSDRIERFKKLCAENPQKCEEIKNRMKERRDEHIQKLGLGGYSEEDIKSFKGKSNKTREEFETTDKVRLGNYKMGKSYNNTGLLKPGMTADVKIIVAHKSNTLFVPAEAVFRIKEKGSVTVIKPDGKTEERKVKIGLSNSSHIEIVEGLREGEKVVVKKVTEGSKWSRQMRFAPSPFGGRMRMMR